MKKVKKLNVIELFGIKTLVHPWDVLHCGSGVGAAVDVQTITNTNSKAATLN